MEDCILDSAVMNVSFSGSSDLENDQTAEEQMRAISMKWAIDIAQIMGCRIRGEIQYEIEVDDEDRVWTVRCKTLVVKDDSLEELDIPRD